MSSVDERYAAKLAARATGTAPVFTAPPAIGESTTQADIDARYRAKLAARAVAASAPATPPAAKPAVVAEPKKSAEPTEDELERLTRPEVSDEPKGEKRGTGPGRQR